MRVRPTELGMKGLLLFVALELAFLATSYSNLFFLLLVFCCVLGSLGLASGIANVSSVHLRSIVVPHGPADAPRLARVDLHTRRRRFDLLLLLDGGGSLVPLEHVPLLAGPQALELEVPPLPRGVMDVSGVRITTHFPFGLFEVSRTFPVALEIVTWPAPAEAPTAADRAEVPEDARQGAAAPASSGVAGLRPFRSGDAVRDVHWKATARRGEPVVREREHGAGDAIDVVIDRRCDVPALEKALARAVGLAFLAKDGDRAVRFESQGWSAVIPAAHAPPPPLLRWFAAAQALPATAEAPPARTGALRLPRPHREEPAHA
jgi:uncharacterized protein (DUF58 family)